MPKLGAAHELKPTLPRENVPFRKTINRGVKRKLIVDEAKQDDSEPGQQSDDEGDESFEASDEESCEDEEEKACAKGKL
jgi:hypothetical protein